VEQLECSREGLSLDRGEEIRRDRAIQPLDCGTARVAGEPVTGLFLPAFLARRYRRGEP
jgi:hypothetical protein